MDLFERLERPTPHFFRRLRNIGLGMTAIGGAILAGPMLLPTLIVQIAGYLIVAGTVTTVVSQTVINDGADDDYPPLDGQMAPEPNPLLNINR